MKCFRNIQLCFILLILLAITFACKSVRSYNSKPATGSAFLNDINSVEMDVIAYHENDSITKIYYRINTSNLMFRKIDSTQNFYAQVYVACKLLPDINSRNIIDSTSIYLNIKFPDSDEAKTVEGFFNLKLGELNYSYLDFWIIDKNKNIKHTHPIDINKKNKQVAQNFLVYNTNGIAFKNTFYPQEDIRIETKLNNNKNAQVSCFYHNFGIALPPFSNQKPDELKYKPDSTYTVNLNQSLTLTMPQSGFCHIQVNPSDMDGLSLFTFEKSYPGVNDIDEMINCTRYIMSKEEFESCKNAENQKQCIDDFWLRIAGSNERAKELLRNYYNRVKEANKRYLSYTQGWKTDRGMIYIIFGEPVNTYKSKNEEIWIYGTELDVNSLKFVFKHTDNPFSNNDFILQRSYVYKIPWYTAVDYWRQGRISSQR